MVTSEDIMTYAVHFLSEAIKYVPISLCNSQLAAIEAVRAIFAKWRTIEASPTFRTTTVPYPPNSAVPLLKPPPVQYPAPTSEGAYGKDRAATSKDVLKHQAPVNYKGGQVPVTYKGDQEPLTARTRSRAAPPTIPLPFEAQHLPLDAPVSAHTRYRKVGKSD